MNRDFGEAPQQGTGFSSARSWRSARLGRVAFWLVSNRAISLVGVKRDLGFWLRVDRNRNWVGL